MSVVVGSGTISRSLKIGFKGGERETERERDRERETVRDRETEWVGR